METKYGSFEDLAMPLFDQLYNFAHWLTRNRDETEDLVQKTYAKALKGFSWFRLGTNFRAWMFRILRNTFLTSRTVLKATMTVPLDSEEDEPELTPERETPETILIERSNWQLVQQRHLPPACALPRDPASLRSGGDVISGDCGNTFHSYRHCDVTLVACQNNARGTSTAGAAEQCSASVGRHNSTNISTANFPPKRGPSSTLMYVSALVAADALARVQIRRTVQVAGKRFTHC